MIYAIDNGASWSDHAINFIELPDEVIALLNSDEDIAAIEKLLVLCNSYGSFGGGSIVFIADKVEWRHPDAITKFHTAVQPHRLMLREGSYYDRQVCLDPVVETIPKAVLDYLLVKWTETMGTESRTLREFREALEAHATEPVDNDEEG